MRIVMFTDAYWPRVNGVTVSVDSFSRALKKDGHEVVIVCSDYPDSYAISGIKKDDREDAPLTIRIPSIPAFVTKEDRIAKLDKWFWVYRQLEPFNPEIVHINTEVIIAEFGLLYARVRNLPVIYTFHTMWEEYAPNYFPMFPSFLVKFFIRRILKSVIRRSDRVIVPTPQIETVVKKYKPKTNTIILPTGIDPDLFNHTEADTKAFREQMEIIHPELIGKRILLMAGRVTREKNIGFLIKILPQILSKHPDVMLLIAGNGPDLNYFKDEARAYGVGNSCVFTGYLERTELSLVYAISEIFVFPSLTDTQGLVTLEAMFSGIPVVAIGVLGTVTIMGGDNGGFMVNNDPDEFTGRVLNLLEDRELYLKKSKEAKKHAKAWSIGEITLKLADIYKETASQYREAYGRPRAPVWELLTDKRWWKINNQIIKKRTRRNVQKIWKKVRRKNGNEK